METLKEKAGWVGVVMLLVGLVAGVLIGPPLLNYHPKPNPTATHLEIVGKFKVIDVNYGSSLVAECVDATESPELSGVTLGKDYEHSVWILYTFKSQGYEGKDANAALELWGPIDDGTYHGMLSKLAGNLLSVFYDDSKVAELDGEITSIGFAISANLTIGVW